MNRRIAAAAQSVAVFTIALLAIGGATQAIAAAPVRAAFAAVTPASIESSAGWAMMLGGFGLMGATMRRREKTFLYA